MIVRHRRFQIHGDNIVECVRAFDYVVGGLGDRVRAIVGPSGSVTCPVYTVRLAGSDLVFQFLPGYGDGRWNQDVLGFVKASGGRLREAADAVITVLDTERERPIAAIEFCGALPAGNQAWQRQGRAFSFAHAGIPYFYVAELGGFELDAGRGRKAERMPNPAVPFSFLAMTHASGSVCLPVYEPSPGATRGTIDRYGSIFGKADFLDYLGRAVLGATTERPAAALRAKCVALVALLAGSKRRQDGLRSDEWSAARVAMLAGQGLPDFLIERAPLPWAKTASIAALTGTAKRFMTLGAAHGLGLTSRALPLSLVPRASRRAFSDQVRALYPDIGDGFVSWLAKDDQHLAIAWVNGFKPRGDDARPDRGLPPFARMLAGDDCALLTFVYGPAPAVHWDELAASPAALARRNGLWEAILGVSDAVLVDSATKPESVPRGYLKAGWATVARKGPVPLRVRPRILQLGEQDVDPALHVAFQALGADVAFEGMCNPPGGDWSGMSFCWNSAEPEHRWLTLPRVSAVGAKRPDHVFALFGHGDRPVCLCIESKERARSLDAEIGPRLTRYAQALFGCAPSISRTGKVAPWTIYGETWQCRDISYVSAGAYLAAPADPFRGLPAGSDLDVQIGVAFADDGRTCTLHLRGDTAAGQALVSYLAGLSAWGDLVTVTVHN